MTDADLIAEARAMVDENAAHLAYAPSLQLVHRLADALERATSTQAIDDAIRARVMALPPDDCRDRATCASLGRGEHCDRDTLLAALDVASGTWNT